MGRESIKNMSLFIPEQLKDMVQHVGENARHGVSALSSTQPLVEMLHLHYCSATCTTETVFQNTP